MEITDEKLFKLANNIAESIAQREQHVQPTQKTIQMFEELNKKSEGLQKGIDTIGTDLKLHVITNQHFSEEVKKAFENQQKRSEEQTATLREMIQLEKEARKEEEERIKKELKDEQLKREEDGKSIKDELKGKASIKVERDIRKVGWLVISIIIGVVVYSVIKR